MADVGRVCASHPRRAKYYTPLRWRDVAIIASAEAMHIRQEMEQAYRAAWNLTEMLVEVS